ncbi:cytochrome c oxidase assembly protein [Blastococcus sp. Marseille-P5729]|uniref:cytochrome c oxidase assembly protein n=1 Tax=Blastococcus sp. Marseille-P5729 TaxID=2086582 RepID=UPI000D108DD7|nr:cytochrome c oxidase assembly protein [Blastococcus sp. Marseille-P5729]
MPQPLAIGVDPSTVPPFTFASIFTETALDPLLLTGVVIAAALYLWGVQRLRHGGVRWPLGRTLSFLVGGLGTLTFVTMSGIGAYDETLFSVHMVQHMVLVMVTPIFLALGAPVTLALRALPAAGRQRLNKVLHWKIARFYMHPLVGFAIFVGSPWLLYFTGWYEGSVRNVWLHQLMHVHFLASGCIFFWPLVGLDPIPGRVSYPFRALILTATLPFHAFLGLTIMQNNALMAGGYYGELDLSWVDAVADQRLGGGLLWASGEFVGLLMLGTALYQWMKASEREAAREDRRLDREEAARARAAAHAAPSSPGPGE